MGILNKRKSQVDIKITGGVTSFTAFCTVLGSSKNTDKLHGAATFTYMTTAVI